MNLNGARFASSFGTMYYSRFQIDRPDLILHRSPTLFSFGVQLDKQWRSTASGHERRHTSAYPPW
jgi:hypothetical protein